MSKNSSLAAKFKWRLPTVIGIALLILFIQAHTQIVTGRLWAEEASVYLQQAADSNNSWYVFFSPTLGYYTLLSRLHAWMLQWVPLIWWGPFSIAISLLLLTLLWWTISQQGLQRGSVILFAPVSVLLANGELLANSLLLNYWYAAGIATLLFSAPPKAQTPARGLLFAVVVLGALSGPHALFLLPVAAGFQFHQGDFRRWINQEWVKLYSLFAVIQACYIAWSLISGSFQTGAAQGGHRFEGWTLVGVAQSLIKYNMVYPVFGYSLLDLPKLLQLTAVAIASCAWFWLIWKASSRLRALVVAVLLLQGMYLAASIGGEGGPRYAFSANVLLILGVAGEAFWNKRPDNVRRVAAAVLLMTALTPFLDQSNRIAKFAHPEWPSWSEAFSRGCAALTEKSPRACIQAWPGDNQHWVFCPNREMMSSACPLP